MHVYMMVAAAVANWAMHRNCVQITMGMHARKQIVVLCSH